jgi:pyruvate dehydrogenase (quinone)
VAFTVSDLLVATVKRTGVRRVYGIPGDSLNGFTDALFRDGSIAWLHVRHEEAAAFAAAADAAVTGQLAVCAASCGPGNLHLINGLYDAPRSRVPVLAIAAHIPSKEIGGNYFQETHPRELFRECSAYCELVSSPMQLPYVMNIAIRTAVELNGAARVTILAGAGCAAARTEVLALAEVLQAPMVHAMPRQRISRIRQPLRRGYDGTARVQLAGITPWKSVMRCSCSARTFRIASSILGTHGSSRSIYAANTSANVCR